MTVSPLAFRIALAVKTSDNPASMFTSCQWCSKPARDARDMLVREGIIDRDLAITEKGIVWIDAALSTPFPVSRWEIPAREDA